MATFGYGSVKRLLQIDNPKDYFGFELRKDGIWLAPPGDERHRYQYEEFEYDFNENKEPVKRASEPAPFEDHDYSKPVLSFPCTQEDLRKFLVVSGLSCMVHPEHEVLKPEKADTSQSYASSNNLPKDFVKKAFEEVYEQKGRMPKNAEVLKSLRDLAHRDEQVGAIVEEVDLEEGGRVAGRRLPLSKNTIYNWLSEIRRPFRKSR